MSFVLALFVRRQKVLKAEALNPGRLVSAVATGLEHPLFVAGRCLHCGGSDGVAGTYC